MTERTLKVGKMLFQFFPDELHQLQKTLWEKHRDIVETLTPGAELEQTLAEVCTALGVAVDGYYELGDFCEMLLRRLENKERRQAGLMELPEHLGMQVMQTQLELEVTTKQEETKSGPEAKSNNQENKSKIIMPAHSQLKH